MPIKPERRRLYPPNWTSLSWAVRFRRARGRCECLGECGDHHIGGRCEERDGKEAVSHRGHVRLAVAHLDHDPTHNSPKNIKALCQRCHLRHDRFEHARERRRTWRRRLGAGQYRLVLVLPGVVLDRGEQLLLSLPVSPLEFVDREHSSSPSVAPDALAA